MFEQPDVRIGGRRTRWFSGAGAAIAIHLALISTAVLIAQTAPARTPRFMKSALTYIALSAPVSVPSEPILIVFPEMADMANLKASAAYVRQDAATLLKDAFASKPVELAKPAPQVAMGAFASSDVPSRTMNANTGAAGHKDDRGSRSLRYL